MKFATLLQEQRIEYY